MECMGPYLSWPHARQMPSPLCYCSGPKKYFKCTISNANISSLFVSKSDIEKNSHSNFYLLSNSLSEILFALVFVLRQYWCCSYRHFNCWGSRIELCIDFLYARHALHVLTPLIIFYRPEILIINRLVHKSHLWCTFHLVKLEAWPKKVQNIE